jgi:hypothetical protein
MPKCTVLLHYIAAGSSTNFAPKMPFIGFIYNEQLAVQLTGKSFYISVYKANSVNG